LDLEAVRSRIAVVMQDYARFPATLRENIGWGYLPKLMADQALSTVLTEAGIDQLPATLAQGLETPWDDSWRTALICRGASGSGWRSPAP
jgi:ATP-binding cassette subfamily B protein